MALTQNEKDDVYMTVSIELVRMFDILSNSYVRPHETEKAQLIADIEKNLRANWEILNYRRKRFPAFRGQNGER